MVSMLTAKQRATQLSTNQLITRGFTFMTLFVGAFLLLINALANDHTTHEKGLEVPRVNNNKLPALRVKENTNKLDSDGKEKKKTKKKKPKIPFLFVHINKTGGTSLIRMLDNNCEEDEYVYENWKHRSEEDGKLYYHRSFHATAHSYLELHGADVWNDAFTFAVVRHPLARQVSNFFFLLERCEEDPEECEGDANDRLIPYGKVSTTESTDEEKIAAFHEWMQVLYETYPPGSRHQYLFGSKGHGNEEYLTFNSTQTSWLVDQTGNNMVVEKVIKLEDLSEHMSLLTDKIPCMKSAPEKMIKKNKTSKYPNYTLFATNERTNQMMEEIYGVDYRNFGYDVIPQA